MKIAAFALVAMFAVLGLAMADERWNNNNFNNNNDWDNDDGSWGHGGQAVYPSGFSGFGKGYGSSYGAGYGSAGYGSSGYGSGSYGYGQGVSYVPLAAAGGKGGAGLGGLFPILMLVILFSLFNNNASSANRVIVLNNTA